MSKKKRVLPRRIAGVKVPKSVRKGGLGDFLASKTGQAMIAEAVTAAAAMAVAGRASAKKLKTIKDGRKARRLLAKTSGRLRDAEDAAARALTAANAALVYAVGEAVRAFSEALRQRGQDGEEGPEAVSTPRPPRRKPRAPAAQAAH